jgi:hypothetical protein
MDIKIATGSGNPDGSGYSCSDWTGDGRSAYFVMLPTRTDGFGQGIGTGAGKLYGCGFGKEHWDVVNLGHAVGQGTGE